MKLNRGHNRRIRSIGGPLLALIALAVAALTVGTPARAATGDLTFAGCVTSEAETGPAGTGACLAIASATPSGEKSPLNRLQSVVASKDGISVYAVGDEGSSLARFARNRKSGKLTYKGCITGDTELGPAGNGACAALASATAGGTESGLDDPDAVLLSADGRWLYVAADNDASVARFKRSRRNGALTYKGCITGALEVGPAGSGACSAIPTATAGGVKSGLGGLEALTLSADGKSLYAAAEGDDAIAHFNRSLRTGRLTYRNCISGERDTGPAGTGACRVIPSKTTGGADSGLDLVRSVSTSADGRSLYAAAGFDDAVARFKRDRRSGRLTYRGCLTGKSAAGPAGTGACSAIPGVTVDGVDSGLDFPDTVVLSPDDRWLYMSTGEAVARFRRDRKSGAVTFRDCITGVSETGPAGTGACSAIPTASPGGIDSGFERPDAMSMTPDGRSLYVVSEPGAGLAHFRRALKTGRLTYKKCISGDSDSGPLGTGACDASPTATAGGGESGFDDVESVAVIGRNAYLVSEDDSAIIRFRRSG